MITPASLLHPDALLSPLAIDEAVHRALDEDLGRAGDITSMATIPEATHAHAVMVARQSGVIAGLPLAIFLLFGLAHWMAHSAIGATVANGAGAPSQAAVSTRALSTMLFQKYLFPFEATSILILIAILGALVLAKKGTE